MNTSCFLIAGPCAAENERQLYETANQLFEQSSHFPFPLSFFRVGIWKPRRNAADFSGAREAAFPWLKKINKDFHFPICVEVATPQHVELCQKNGITNVWIGARTSVNPFAVQELAESMCGGNFTVLVKNPIIPDLKLWIGNLERIEKIGVQKLFAIHRGFAENTENVLRNRPMWEIPIALRVARPDIPILCDPSHISGNTQYIKQIAQISIDYGFDGLMIETHYQPQSALSDASQQFTPAELTQLLSELIFKEHSNALPNELLRKPRTLIRNIDTQMGQLLAQRMKLIEEIAEIKQKNNLPLVQPEQWNQVVKTYQNAALKDELYQEFLQNFLNLLHQYSLQKQQKNQ